MLAVVTPEEMGAIDAAAPEPVEILIARAGGAAARAARALLGGTYGRRVAVVAGRGNNGNDGREAARRLRAAGARVVEIDPSAEVVPRGCDLVIDAAFGTGFRGSWVAPRLRDRPRVLAVDIPSGVDGLTGVVDAATTVLRADATVTFAALKPGLLLGAGAQARGVLEVADIGLDVSSARTHLVGASDVAGWLPRRAVDDHKWRHAVWVIGGSPGMFGAVALACAGAQRAGAGYVRVSIPGAAAEADRGPALPVEVVRTPLAATGFWPEVQREVHRFGALVIGNGLGSQVDAADVRSVVASSPVPVVVDADGLRLLGDDPARVVGPDVVLTPHDGEFAALAGAPPGPDRIGATRALAAQLGAVVLLKGPCTLVAHPDGRVLASAAGDARLATAGTGDVLAGVIGALCARGLEPFRAAAAAAYLHGAAAALGWPDGLIAGDLPVLVAEVLASLAGNESDDSGDGDRAAS